MDAEFDRASVGEGKGLCCACNGFAFSEVERQLVDVQFEGVAGGGG